MSVKTSLKKMQSDLIDQVLLERDKLRAENERLKEALKKIFVLWESDFSSDYLIEEAVEIAKKALKGCE